MKPEVLAAKAMASLEFKSSEFARKEAMSFLASVRQERLELVQEARRHATPEISKVPLWRSITSRVLGVFSSWLR